jgi:hypothetical protein
MCRFSSIFNRQLFSFSLSHSTNGSKNELDFHENSVSVSLWKWKRADEKDFLGLKSLGGDLELENDEKAHCEIENKTRRIDKSERENEI